MLLRRGSVVAAAEEDDSKEPERDEDGLYIGN